MSDPVKNYNKFTVADFKNGRKRSHWIWYIFPQLKGLGYSHNAEFYGIDDVNEAEAYLNHPVLGARLKEITQALLDPGRNETTPIMGYPDDLKLKSSMTLFSQVKGADPVFQAVLDQYFNGTTDQQTLGLLKRH